MKFSVWDYSQIKIAQFNTSHPSLAIDPTDIFIFTWFKGFATKTKSKSSENTHSKGMWTKTIDGVDYFNIRYEAIIKDFPILSFTSVKSIQRRFDKYIEAGIFVKKIIYSGKKGNFTYFAFTDLFWSFEYDNNNPEHKPVGADNSVRTKSLGADNSVQTKSLGVDNSVQTKSLGADNSVQTKPVGVDNSVQTKSLGVDNSVQTKPVGVDNSVQTKTLGVDNSVQTKTLGVDNSVQTLINNPTTSLNNPTTTSSREINFISKENTDSFMQAEAENIILEKLKELFGGHLVFDESFIPSILSLSKEFELEKNQIQGFLQFVFDRVSEKKPNSLTNLYYKMAKSPAVIQDYVLSLQKLQKETKSKDKDMALCPICGSRANIYGQCSCCNFEMLDRFDRKKVSIKKQIYELPKNDKEAFNREFEAELKRQKTFGVVAMLTNQTLRAEFQERLKNIYHKYGITA